MSRSPLSLPSSSILHLAAGESSCRGAAGSIHLYDSKPNKMRIGIDPQVLSRTIKHRFQQTVLPETARGWVPGVWRGIGCGDDGATPQLGVQEGCWELWGAQSSSWCHGVWLCWAGWSSLPAPGSLLSCDGGIWGTLRVGGVHGGVKRAEWVPIAGAGRRWVGRCAPVGAAVHGGSTHPPLIVAAPSRVDTALCRCAQTLSGTRTEQLSNHRTHSSSAHRDGA